MGWKDMYDEDKTLKVARKKNRFMGGKWGYTVYIDVIVLVRANGKIRPLCFNLG